MKMRESEIFNNYIKLALDAGVISEDGLTKTAEKKAKDDELSDVEILYGHKLGPNFGESIIELAHPETVVIAPAYDAMNSVLENEHQRHDIMTYVALKMPDGLLVQRRYVAANNLLQSLVAAGFTLDNADETGLMKLADSCAERISKQATPLLLYPAIALVGALGYMMYGATSVQNVSANSQIVLDRAHELSSKPYAQSIIKEVSALKDLSDMFYSAKDSVIANSLGDVVDQAATSQAKALVDLTNKYKAQQAIVMQKMPQWQGAINSSLESGSGVGRSDAFEKFRSMFGGIIPDKFISYLQTAGDADERELLEELDALQGAIAKSSSLINPVDNMAQKYVTPIQQLIDEKVKPIFDNKEDKNKPSSEEDELNKTVEEQYGFNNA